MASGFAEHPVGEPPGQPRLVSRRSHDQEPDRAKVPGPFRVPGEAKRRGLHRDVWQGGGGLRDARERAERNLGRIVRVGCHALTPHPVFSRNAIERDADGECPRRENSHLAVTKPKPIKWDPRAAQMEVKDPAERISGDEFVTLEHQLCRSLAAHSHLGPRCQRNARQSKSEADPTGCVWDRPVEGVAIRREAPARVADLHYGRAASTNARSSPTLGSLSTIR